MTAVGLTIDVILWVFIACLVVRFVADWVRVFARNWKPSGPILILLEAAYSVTDPPIMALRKVIPPLRLGSVALDLSFMIVFFVALLLKSLNTAIFLAV